MMERVGAAEESRLRQLMISPDEPISSALRQMDSSGDRILFVVDSERHLAGVATDGDIRRWLIGGNRLDEPISRAMNAEPISLPEGSSIEDAKEALIGNKIDCLPVVDSAGTVVSAVWWMDLFDTGRAVAPPLHLPVIILAGGEGARLSPYTKVLPKPLMPIGETPVVELIMERFFAAGCTDFRLTVNYKANLIRAYFADLSPEFSVRFVEEPTPLGTAGSLALLEGQIEGPFFVTNCDILVDTDYAKLLAFHQESGHAITLVASAKRFTIPYGVCEVDPGGLLSGIAEKPGYDLLVSTGMYVLDASVIEAIPEGVPYQMTDLIAARIGAGDRVGVYPVSEASWMDMGRFEELESMRSKLGMV